MEKGVQADASMDEHRQIDRMSVDRSPDRLMEAIEIKQEPNIKDEPQPIDELDEFPPLNNAGEEVSLAECHQFGEIHANNYPIDDVKIEVKAECGEMLANTSKLKKAKKKAKKKRRGEHSLEEGVIGKNNRSNRNGNGKPRTKKSAKANEQGRASKQHRCTLCDYAATCKSQLERHLRKHTGEKPFKCKHCSKAFTQNHTLQNHMKVHAKDFSFNCSVCLCGFDEKNEKTKHEINCKALRYECHLCKKSFGTKKTNFMVHMRLHSDEKEFECKKCFKQFTLESSINKHMKLHAGPRPFRCLKCHLAFTQENKRNEHEEKCKRRTFLCYVCGKTFGNNKGNLDQHMRIHSGDKPFACNECPKKFARKYLLNNHQKIHSRSLLWKCAICRQGFAKPTQCKAHQSNCRRLGYECHLCKKFFGSTICNLKNHILTHTGEKPFKCQICQNRFTRKTNLNTHINSIHNKKR